MSYVGDGSGECEDEGCLEFRFDTDAALREGWDSVEGRLYCPLHRQEAARRALAAAEVRRMQETIGRLRRERHEREAKAGLSPAEYRAWDEFQSDLVNFHKTHGKLAPAVLRTMDPRRWLAHYGETGRIDIDQVADELFAKEEAARKTRDWLMHRL